MTSANGTNTRIPASDWGLALGGGGSVGIAYVAGALGALADHGLNLPSAGLLVGTSAGAVAAAALRNGAKPDELLTFAQAAPDDVATAAGRSPKHFERAWSDGLELCHRVVGSGAVVARSVMRVPLPLPSPAIGALFPAGRFRHGGTAWPPAWATSGRRTRSGSWPWTSPPGGASRSAGGPRTTCYHSTGRSWPAAPCPASTSRSSSQVAGSSTAG